MLLLAEALFLCCIVISEAECPQQLPVEIGGQCFRFTTDLMSFNNARDNCMKYDGVMTSVKSKDVLETLEKLAEDYIVSNTENAAFWIGLTMDDRDAHRKAVKDRLWKWDYDKTQFKQKDYKLWDVDEGPTDSKLTCGALNVSENFLVKAVDCGAPRLPVLCMMDEDKKCKHDTYSYLVYGKYCVAGIPGAVDNNKISATCSPNSPAAYQQEMQDYVTLAAKNYFLGGAVFMNMRRTGDSFFDLSDGSQPKEEWWEEGEPREDYDCVGLSFQLDNTLRLRTINCEFYAASLCVAKREQESTTTTESSSTSTSTTTAEPTTTTSTTTEETTSTTEPSTTTTTTEVPTTTTTEDPTTTTTLATTTTTEEETTTTSTTTEQMTTTTTEPTTTSTTTETSTTSTTSEPTSTTTTMEPTTTTTTTERPTTTTTTTEAPTTTTTTTAPTTTTTTEMPTTTTTTEKPTTTTTTEKPTTTTTTTEQPTTTTTTTETPTTSSTTTTTEAQDPTTTTTEQSTTNADDSSSTTTTTTTEPTSSETTSSSTSSSSTSGSSTSTSTEPTSTEEGSSSTSTESQTSSTTEKTTSTSTTTEEPTTTTTEVTTTTTEPTTTTTEATTTTTEATTTTTEATTTTTEATTTTTEATTTTEETTTTGPRTGVYYNETADYYYPNIARNSTTTDDSCDLDISNGPLGFGWAIDLDKNYNDSVCCLKMDVNYLNDDDENCLKNPENCGEGISLSIWIKVTFYRDDTELNRYILSTGPATDGGPGIELYFRGIYFYVIVSTGKDFWNTSAPGPVKNNTWYEMGIKWSKDIGLEFFVNADRVAYVPFSESVDSSSSPDNPGEVTVGCRKGKDGAYEDHAHGEYDELTIWMRALQKEHEDYLLGGADPNSTCNPSEHPMKCETNIDKILADMDSMKIDDASSLNDAMSYMKSLSEVPKDPPGSENDDDEEAENNICKSQRTQVAIVEKLIEKTWDKPNELSLKEFNKLIKDVQDIASNLIGSQYEDCWIKWSKEGKSNIEVVNLIIAYQLHKLTQTDNGEEPIKGNTNSSNILTSVKKDKYIKMLGASHGIQFPQGDDDDDEDENNDSEEEDRKRRKRETKGGDNSTEESGQEDEEEEKEPEEKNVKFTVTKELYGEIDKSQKVSFIGAKYARLHRFCPLWNKNTGNDSKYVYIESEIATAKSDPAANSETLRRNPITITFSHMVNKKRATQRVLLADKDLEENGEIRKRECVRWDPNLEIKGSKTKGGWTTDSCTMANTSAEESTCQCTMLGTYAVISKIKHPFFIPPEDEWVTITKYIGFGLSIILLIFYIVIIVIRKYLHEQFHIIRLNLALAALGALLSFMLSNFLYEDEETCRILSILIHLFYTAVGMWLISEAHALFSALVNGSFGGKYTFYIMIGWVFPMGMVGGLYSVVYDYGYDYRCLVGPTTNMRLLLVAPILISAIIAFTLALLTCINYGTPAVKKTVIVNELSSATRYNFIVVILFLSTWFFGIFALVDLGFDYADLPAFNPIFQILNSLLGVFIVTLIGFGSKHFRYCICHTKQNETKTKTLNLDPFDIHDKANVEKRKKIYAS